MVILNSVLVAFSSVLCHSYYFLSVVKLDGTLLNELSVITLCNFLHIMDIKDKKMDYFYPRIPFLFYFSSSVLWLYFKYPLEKHFNQVFSLLSYPGSTLFNRYYNYYVRSV